MYYVGMVQPPKVTRCVLGKELSSSQLNSFREDRVESLKSAVESIIQQFVH